MSALERIEQMAFNCYVSLKHTRSDGMYALQSVRLFSFQLYDALVSW